MLGVGWATNPPRARQGFGGWSGVERRLHIKRQGAAGPLLSSDRTRSQMGRLLFGNGQRVRGPTVSPAKGLPDPPFCCPFRRQIFGLAARFHSSFRVSCREWECGGRRLPFPRARR
ncbi:hypothetical protein GWK47_005170 [Chionoecetes opilio]|uniref:Uncharacterized protein n=1 Tax=Chionoecetes opilio TaxID=41210 RepID=A0A8J5CZS3_CHIOP|nr:hypothetical protein GWK47_005170 [Chionoecetes opilio]